MPTPPTAPPVIFNIQGRVPANDLNINQIGNYMRSVHQNLALSQMAGVMSARLKQKVAYRDIMGRETLLQRRQEQLADLSDQIAQYYGEFGSVLNDRALDFLNKQAQINVPTFTSILAGFENARASRADMEKKRLDEFERLMNLDANLQKERIALRKEQMDAQNMVAQAALEGQSKMAAGRIEAATTGLKALQYSGTGHDLPAPRYLSAPYEQQPRIPGLGGLGSLGGGGGRAAAKAAEEKADLSRLINERATATETPPDETTGTPAKKEKVEGDVMSEVFGKGTEILYNTGNAVNAVRGGGAFADPSKFAEARETYRTYFKENPDALKKMEEYAPGFTELLASDDTTPDKLGEKFVEAWGKSEQVHMQNVPGEVGAATKATTTPASQSSAQTSTEEPLWRRALKGSGVVGLGINAAIDYLNNSDTQKNTPPTTPATPATPTTPATKQDNKETSSVLDAVFGLGTAHAAESTPMTEEQIVLANAGGVPREGEGGETVLTTNANAAATSSTTAGTQSDQSTRQSTVQPVTLSPEEEAERRRAWEEYLQKNNEETRRYNEEMRVRREAQQQGFWGKVGEGISSALGYVGDKLGDLQERELDTFGYDQNEPVTVQTSTAREPRGSYDGFQVGVDNAWQRATNDPSGPSISYESINESPYQIPDNYTWSKIQEQNADVVSQREQEALDLTTPPPSRSSYAHPWSPVGITRRLAKYSRDESMEEYAQRTDEILSKLESIMRRYSDDDKQRIYNNFRAGVAERLPSVEDVDFVNQAVSAGYSPAAIVEAYRLRVGPGYDRMAYLGRSAKHVNRPNEYLVGPRGNQPQSPQTQINWTDIWTNQNLSQSSMPESPEQYTPSSEQYTPPSEQYRPPSEQYTPSSEVSPEPVQENYKPFFDDVNGYTQQQAQSQSQPEVQAQPETTVNPLQTQGGYYGDSWYNPDVSGTIQVGIGAENTRVPVRVAAGRLPGDNRVVRLTDGNGNFYDVPASMLGPAQSDGRFTQGQTTPRRAYDDWTVLNAQDRALRDANRLDINLVEDAFARMYANTMGTPGIGEWYPLPGNPSQNNMVPRFYPAQERRTAPISPEVEDVINARLNASGVTLQNRTSTGQNQNTSRAGQNQNTPSMRSQDNLELTPSSSGMNNSSSGESSGFNMNNQYDALTEEDLAMFNLKPIDKQTPFAGIYVTDEDGTNIPIPNFYQDYNSNTGEFKIELGYDDKKSITSKQMSVTTKVKPFSSDSLLLIGTDLEIVPSKLPTGKGVKIPFSDVALDKSKWEQSVRTWKDYSKRYESSGGKLGTRAEAEANPYDFVLDPFEQLRELYGRIYKLRIQGLREGWLRDKSGRIKVPGRETSQSSDPLGNMPRGDDAEYLMQNSSQGNAIRQRYGWNVRGWGSRGPANGELEPVNFVGRNSAIADFVALQGNRYGISDQENLANAYNFILNSMMMSESGAGTLQRNTKSSARGAFHFLTSPQMNSFGNTKRIATELLRGKSQALDAFVQRINAAQRPQDLSPYDEGLLALIHDEFGGSDRSNRSAGLLKKMVVVLQSGGNGADGHLADAMAQYIGLNHNTQASSIPYYRKGAGELIAYMMRSRRGFV